MDGERLFERVGERHDAIFASLARRDADLTAVEIDVGEADGDQLTDADASVE